MEEKTYTIQRCDLNGCTKGFENCVCPSDVISRITYGVAIGAMRNFVEMKYLDRVTGEFYLVRERTV